jgi:hypothetical protein
LLRQQAA